MVIKINAITLWINRSDIVPGWTQVSIVYKPKWTNCIVFFPSGSFCSSDRKWKRFHFLWPYEDPSSLQAKTVQHPQQKQTAQIRDANTEKTENKNVLSCDNVWTIWKTFTTVPQGEHSLMWMFLLWGLWFWAGTRHHGFINRKNILISIWMFLKRWLSTVWLLSQQ